MNGYELSRKWFDFCFENPELINPNHSALYFFAIEHCNRLGWKKKFGFPTTMAKEALGIKSYNTYVKTLNDLVEWGFIEMLERSKNQHSSNIVALSNFDKPLDNALDKALIRHTTKQSESTCESNSSIDKQLTIEQYNQLNNLTRNEVFGIELLESENWLETIAMQNKLIPTDVSNWIDSFNKKLISELTVKNSKQDYAAHFSRWLTNEIQKSKKSQSNGTGTTTTRNRNR